MPLLKKLAMYECKGLKIPYDEIVKLKKNLILNMVEFKKLIFNKTGEVFDIDSNKALKTILFKKFGYDQLLSSKCINIRGLEPLGMNNSVVRNIVFYKRIYKQISNIESIIKSSENFKIFPIFKLTSSNCGFISSNSPDIFKLKEYDIFVNSMPINLQNYFFTQKNSFEKLLKLSNELQNWPQIKTHIAERLPVNAKSIDIAGYLLKYITGYSEIRLVNFFMIDNSTVKLITNELEFHLPILFNNNKIYKSKCDKKRLCER